MIRPGFLSEDEREELRALARDGRSEATDPYALRALAQALQALARKLTEAQAQQALAPILQQIGKTDIAADLAVGLEVSCRRYVTCDGPSCKKILATVYDGIVVVADES